MRLLDKIRLAKRMNAAADEFDEGMRMKDSTKIIAAIIAAVTGILEIPSVMDAIKDSLGHHPAVLVAVIGVVKILLLVHDPKNDQHGTNLQASQKGSCTMRPMLTVLVISLVALFAVSAMAQAAPPAQIDNLYAAGVSYNNGGSPAVAGTALYAHRVADAGTYAFTVADFVPISKKPFTVSSNIGVGVAQKVFTVGKIPIYAPTSAGISFNGNNTGWSWTAGGMAAITVKDNWRVLPSVRVVKSSVSGGSGFQPIVAVLFGWGQ